MRTKKNIEETVDQVLGNSGFFLTGISVNRSNVIRVFIDHAQRVTLDDCAIWHKKIEAALDRDQEDFELQVSSSGLDQPLHDIRQYPKHKGSTLRLWMKDGAYINGVLTEVYDDRPNDSYIVVLPKKTRKRPNPDLLMVRLSEIKTAKVEIKF